jgi:2-oxoisovalerate dehydrogenase E2 component (dihydrolipoyl transacylase)
VVSPVPGETRRREFRLPDLGEGLTEADVVAWRVAPGDVVAVNDVLAEVETAKAAVELPSPFAGTVAALLVEPGRTVPVGTPIVAIDTVAGVGSSGSSGSAGSAATTPAGEPGPAEGARPEPPGASTPDGGSPDAPRLTAPIGEAGPDGRIATLVGYGPRPGPARRRPRRAGGPERQQGDTAGTQRQQGGTADIAAAVAGAPAGTPGATPAPVPLAKPPVRKLARDLGVDLRAVAGTGPAGVITRDDVRGAAPGPGAASGAAGAPATVPTGPAVPDEAGTRREPVRGVRRATAEAMVASAFTAPHVTEFLAVDVTATMALRDRLRGTHEYADVPLSPLAFVAKVVCLALRRTPVVNARWADEEIVYHDRVRLGIAAATPRGLLVPTVRDADTLSLRALAGALHELTTVARAGRTPPADLTGGTFTITNVGVFGVDTGTPILNPGEAGILAVGAIKQAPWVVNGALAVRTVCQLALSFDHRLVDGEQGSRFLADVGALLTDPGLALTW